MKFTLRNSDKFDWKGVKGYVYSNKKDFKNASCALLVVSGSHGKVKTTLSDRVYYITEGYGEFLVGDEIFKVKKSDAIIVPKNTIYDFWATKNTLKLFMVTLPAYDERYEKKIS